MRFILFHTTRAELYKQTTPPTNREEAYCFSVCTLLFQRHLALLKVERRALATHLFLDNVLTNILCLSLFLTHERLRAPNEIGSHARSDVQQFPPFCSLLYVVAFFVLPVRQFCGWCHLVLVGVGLLALHALFYKSVFTFTAAAALLINFLWW